MGVLLEVRTKLWRPYAGKSYCQPNSLVEATTRRASARCVSQSLTSPGVRSGAALPLMYLANCRIWPRYPLILFGFSRLSLALSTTSCSIVCQFPAPPRPRLGAEHCKDGADSAEGERRGPNSTVSVELIAISGYL